MSQQINLFNPVFLKQEKLFSATTMAQGLGVILIAVVAFSAYSTFRLNRTTGEAAVAAQTRKVAQENLVIMIDKTRVAAVDKTIEEAIQQAEGRLRASQQILMFVQNGDFRSGRAFSSTMRAFAGKTMAGLWLTGFTLANGGNEIEVDGRALQPALIAAYISSLRSEPAFAGKSFGSMVLRAPAAEATTSAAASASAPATAPAPAPAPEGLRYVSFSLSSSEAIQESTQNAGVPLK